MEKPYPDPFNLHDWIERHYDDLRPPVGNKLIFGHNTELQVMAVRGPNRRPDFHVEAGEEFFYQLKGDMTVRVIVNDEFQSITVHQGQVFLLPAQTPHSPQRTPGSIGIVVERQRAVGELDRLEWYCDRCNQVVHEERFHCKELDSQLTPIMNKYSSLRADVKHENIILQSGLQPELEPMPKV